MKVNCIMRNNNQIYYSDKKSNITRNDNLQYIKENNADSMTFKGFKLVMTKTESRIIKGGIAYLAALGGLFSIGYAVELFSNNDESSVNIVKQKDFQNKKQVDSLTNLYCSNTIGSQEFVKKLDELKNKESLLSDNTVSENQELKDKKQNTEKIYASQKKENLKKEEEKDKSFSLWNLLWIVPAGILAIIFASEAGNSIPRSLE